MALENDLKLLDDYLSNRLTGQDKAAFEQKLQADPELQQEVKFQQDLIQGIRQARVAELKAILNTVPVAPVNVGPASVATKIISAVAIVGVVSTAVYFYLDKNETSIDPATQKEAVDLTETEQPEQPDLASINDGQENSENEPISARGTEKEIAPAIQPKLEVYTPEETEADQLQAKKEHAQLEIISRAFVTSSIEVETESNSRKLNFHYMFKDNKLILFGSFENNLYEILEFIAGDQRTVFLYFNNGYYLLDLDKTTPTELVPIRDKALLNKLKQYRGN
jgi:hypothetical protein